MNKSVDISYKTIFFIATFLGLLWAVFLIKDVIILLFVAIIFMSAFSPLVKRMQSFKIPKTLAITIVYLFVVGLIVLLVSFVLKPLLDQTANLITNLPQFMNKLLPENGVVDKSVLQQELGSFSKNAVEFTLAAFGNLLGFISVAVLTFYLLLERDNLDQLISQFAIGHENRARRIIDKIEDKLGSWMRGQIVLSLIIGLAAFVLLSLLQIPYALPLAILAGIMEVVPVIGPIISAIPAILLGYLISPLLALWVALGFFVIQQLENHLIVPQVMKHAVGLNPLIVILAVAIGGRILGVSGALLAVPITVVIQIIIEDVIRGTEI